MKKIALTVAALASLGLAACGDKADEANTVETNVEATTENALEDVNAATAVADNALENAAAAAENAADAAGDAAENIANAQ